MSEPGYSSRNINAKQSYPQGEKRKILLFNSFKSATTKGKQHDLTSHKQTLSHFGKSTDMYPAAAMCIHIGLSRPVFSFQKLSLMFCPKNWEEEAVYGFNGIRS